MSFWESIVLGIVQGLTEFLPISSSAHVRVVGALLPGGGDPGAAFTAVTQIGTEAAVLLYFRHDIARILRGFFGALGGRDGRSMRARLGGSSVDARLGWWVLLGSLPIVILGVLFQDVIESKLRNLWIIVVVLVVFALVLAVADKVGVKMRSIETLRGRDALALGLAQAAAVVPGVSRSGGTISMGLFLGLTREAAARYSFLLAIPAVLGSGVYELITSRDDLTAVGSPGLLATGVAALVAFAVGYVVIVWFLKVITTHSFLPFVAYRIVFALVTVGLLLAGTIPATA